MNARHPCKPYHAILLVLLCLWSFAAHATPGITITDDRADFALAVYEETAIDLRVKVLGGFIEHRRHLDDGHIWSFNPAWADLELVFGANADPDDADPVTIKRNGFSYRAISGAAGPVWVFDERKRIARTDTGYRWSDHHGNWIEYDRAGQIAAYGDRNDVRVHFTRDGDNRIATVQDHHRRIILTHAYDAAGRLETVNDYSGRTVRYRYNDKGLLEQVTDVRGESWRYAYTRFPERGDLLTSRTDPRGNTRTIDYVVQDGSGGACTHAAGGQWTYSANGARWTFEGARCLSYTSQPSIVILQSVKDDEGLLSTYKFYYDSAKESFINARVDGENGLIVTHHDLIGRVQEAWQNGRRLSRIEDVGQERTHSDEANRQTLVTYDAWRNPVKTVHPDGTSTTRTYDPQYSNVLEAVDENGVVTKYDYDPRGNLIRRIDAIGLPEQRSIEYGYDEFGNLTSIRFPADDQSADASIALTYDTFGNLTSLRDAEGNLTELDLHDALGNVQEITDARGNAWKFAYDAGGNPTRRETPLGHVTQYAYDATGNLTTITDANEQATRLVYDRRDRLVSVTNPLDEITQYRYNRRDQLIAVVDPLNHARRLEYDQAGRPSRIIDGNGLATELEYGGADEMGPQGHVHAITYPSYRQTFTYDPRNRLTAVNDSADDAASRLLAFTRDPAGHIIGITDAAERLTTLAYDGLHRITQIIDPADRTTRFGHDARNNLIEVINPRNVPIRRYQYDRNGRPIRELLPDGTALQALYDPAGNLARRIDPKGQITTFEYDPDNRLTTVRYYPDAEGESPSKAVSFSYDRLNRLTGYADGTTTGTYAYDAVGRLTEGAVDYGPFTLSFAYTYLANGLRRTYTGPDGLTYEYNYDAADQLTSITIPGQGLYTVNERRWSVPTRSTLPGGSVQTVTRDGYLRPLRLQSLDPAGNRLLDEAYVNDTVDNIVTRTTPAGAVHYLYDEADQLTGLSGDSGVRAYGYDPAGNRLIEQPQAASERSTETWVYDDRDRLIQRDPTLYEYDPNGSLIRRSDATTGEAVHFTYDAGNRLTEVHDQGGVSIASYAYDPFGRRIEKAHGGEVTHYLYTPDGLVAEADRSGNVTTTYGYAPSAPWGTNPIFISQGGHFGYYHTDRLGTPLLVTSASGETLWQAHYDTFGHAQLADTAITSNLRFPGQYFDAETGLHYNFQRYYDPSIGRYITSDPLGIDGGLNTYTYAANNPLRYTDPTGDIICGGVCAGVIAGALALWNGYDTISQAVDTVRTVSDDCASPGEKYWAVGLFALGIIDPTPGNISRSATAGIADHIPKRLLGYEKRGLLRYDGPAVAARGLQRSADAAQAVTNPVSDTLARVVPADIELSMLGKPGAPDVFVTNASELRGLSASQIAEKLTIPEGSSYRVIEFPASSVEGIASPINRGDPGFIQGGRTAGGAPEFVIPNGPIPPGAIERIVD